MNQILGLEAVASTQPNVDFMKRIHPDDLAAAGAELERSTLENDICKAEFCIVRPDGTVRWVRDHSRPFYNEKGEHMFCTGVVHDVTDLKKAENALADERKRMETILAVLNTGLALINPDMTVDWVNAQTLKILPWDDLVGSRYAIKQPRSAKSRAKGAAP